MHARGRYVNHETCIATVYYDPSRLRRRNKANPPAASCPWLSLHCHAIQQYAISSSFLFNLSLCHYSNLSTTPSSSVFILSFLPSTPSYCGSLSLCRSPFQSLLRHTAAVLKIQLQSRCLSGLVGEGWLEVRQRQGVFGGHYWPVTVCVSGTVLPGDPAPAESHLHTRQLDKHKWEELVDVKAPSTL